MNGFFRYFAFSRGERRGLIVLLLFVFLLSIIPLFFDLLRKEASVLHRIVYLPDIDEQQIKGREAREVLPRSTLFRKEEDGNNIEYFYFDPNSLSSEDWRKLGLSDKQISVIKNYLKKGGKFFKREDLAKIYSISERDYKRLAPFIQIDKSKKEKGLPEKKLEDRSLGFRSSTKISKGTICINKADTMELKKLPGIGSVLANRIIKYRDVLGGFHSTIQVGEVYGISPDVFEKMKSFMTIEQEMVNKININEANKEDIAKHPYISWKQAQLIVNYRMQNGSFQNIDDLAKVAVLDVTFLLKIQPYLAF